MPTAACGRSDREGAEEQEAQRANEAAGNASRGMVEEVREPPQHLGHPHVLQQRVGGGPEHEADARETQRTAAQATGEGVEEARHRRALEGTAGQQARARRDPGAAEGPA